MERNYVTVTLCILIKRSVTKTAILTADAVVDVDATVRTRDETRTELRFADTLTTATAYLSRFTYPITCRNTQCRHNCVEPSVRTVSASQNYTQGEIKLLLQAAWPIKTHKNKEERHTHTHTHTHTHNYKLLTYTKKVTRPK